MLALEKAKSVCKYMPDFPYLKCGAHVIPLPAQKYISRIPEYLCSICKYV